MQAMVIVDQLRAEAENQRATAKLYEGCTFYGDWPGGRYLSVAALLEMAALQIIALLPPPKTAAEIAAAAAEKI